MGFRVPRIAKKSLMGVVKWVSKMNELMSVARIHVRSFIASCKVVNTCMDSSLVPFYVDDFSRPWPSV